jgi:hypothetical protein
MQMQKVIVVVLLMGIFSLSWSMRCKVGNDVLATWKNWYRWKRSLENQGALYKMGIYQQKFFECKLIRASGVLTYVNTMRDEMVFEEECVHCSKAIFHTLALHGFKDIANGISRFYKKNSYELALLVAALNHEQFITFMSIDEHSFLLIKKFWGYEFIRKKLIECAEGGYGDQKIVAELLQLLLRNDPQDFRLLQFFCRDFDYARTFFSDDQIVWFCQLIPFKSKMMLEEAYNFFIERYKKDGKVVLPFDKKRIGILENIRKYGHG